MSDQPDIINARFAQEDELVSRRNLRHLLTRRRNERISARQTDNGWPVTVYAHPDTISELSVDNDPEEAHTMDFEGKLFMQSPLIGDPSLERGVFVIEW